MNEVIYFGGRRLTGLGDVTPPATTPAVTWVDWYNANAAEQSSFDDATTALDDPSTTPDQKANYISVFGGSDDEKAALSNYVATGGRAALFAASAKNYGPNPIAVIKPSGPIESAPGGVTLHPGTYTYSDVSGTDDGFEQWVLANGATVKRTVVQTSASALPGGAAYYTDNVLVVYQDTLWPASLTGLPTWLPPGADAIKYWGKVTPPAKPNWDALSLPKPTTSAWIGITAVVVVVGAALIVYYVPRRAPQNTPAKAP